ncbi:MAG: hypothetical protein JST09_13575 [Bacteroidetes bacterium]|nr:hypothetical protein [Bacteroidota bacterium]MBS1608974.1 hypothetical protein [Bacteroidota bacterium]
MKYVPTLLTEYFAKGYTIKPLNENTYSWDYGMTYNDGTTRFQYVYLSEITEKEKDLLYIYSHVADFSDKLNAMQLLREAEYATMSCICLKSITREGVQIEGVYVQCIFPAELAMQHKELFLAVVHEVATLADAIEKKYIGVDN